MALSFQRTVSIGSIVVAAGAMFFAVQQLKLVHEQERAEQAQLALEARQAAQARAAASGPAPQVIALWTGRPVPGEPMGVHVADVSVDTSGAVSLMLADNQKTRAAVEAAIARARLQPALPRPGDPSYASAVADYLAAQTGFKPQLQSR